MELTNQVWLWLILSGVLLGSEMFTGTFYLLFFGFAALITAGFAYFEPSLVLQILVFGILAMLSVWWVKKRGIRSQSLGFANDLAQTIEISTPIQSGQEGTVRYQGAPWRATNSGPDLHPGDRAKILKTEGVRLYLTKIGES